MKSYLNVFKPQSLTLTVLAAGAAFVGFTQASQAGFEWIPPKPAPQAQPAPEPLKVKPMTAPQEEMSAPADEAFLPIPSDEPVVETQPTVEAQPLQADDMASPAATEDSAPMPITARPEQQQIKTLHVGQTEPMEDKTAAMPMVEPADDMMTPAPEQPTKAVMPADTPENVKQAVADNSDSLSINPNPTGGPRSSHSEVQAPFSEATVEDADVVGFGSDIPLALALQQVAPAGYAFSFGETINPGAKVSWDGGDNWVTVMRRMIEPLGLQADISGRVILISHKKHTAAEDAVPADIDMIEPAAGEPTTITAPIEPQASAETETVNIQRVSVNDPGQAEQAQPSKTVKVLSERQPVAKVAPENPGADSKVWEAEKGASLKSTLESWSKVGGFELKWSAMHDYTLESDILVAGGVKTALKSLMTSGISAEEGPSISFEGQTLTVEERV